MTTTKRTTGKSRGTKGTEPHAVAQQDMNRLPSQETMTGHMGTHSTQQSPRVQQTSPVQLAQAGGAAAVVPPPQQPIVQVQAQPQQPIDPLTQSTAETWLSIASLAETLGDADRAAMAYDATLQYNPSSTKALTSLAHLYRSRDMFQRAAELYQRALSVNPELGDIWATLGHCYLMLDDLQRAYAAYQQALYHLSNPNVPKLWHGIGILYDRYGSLDYAEEAFAKVLELDPQFEKANEIYFRLGIIYKHQGKWNQALECFRYILTQPPAPLQEWDVWFQLGSVLESMGEWQGAREAYEHVLMQNERHAKVLQQLGCLYGMQNVQFYDTQTALNLLLKSLEVDSTDATTWYHLGRIHMVRNDYTAAYDAFQHAVNRDSRNPTFWCSIGVLYYQISQYRDALDAYTRAIRLNPYISEVWYDLGTLYETCNNQVTDALDAYKQAARLDPNNIHIRERLDALTAQLANQSNGSALPAQSKVAAVGNPPPIMLQPALQSSDGGNPLNKTSLYVQPQVQAPVQPQLQPQLQAQMQSQQQSQSHPLPQPQAMHQQFQHQSHTHQVHPQLPSQQQQLQPLPATVVHPQGPMQLPSQPQGGIAAVMNSPQPAMGNAGGASSNQLPQILNQQQKGLSDSTLPQKRAMEGGMDTLVNAAVSSAANAPPQNHIIQMTEPGTETAASEAAQQKKQKRNSPSTTGETALNTVVPPESKSVTRSPASQEPSEAPPVEQAPAATSSSTNSEAPVASTATTSDPAPAAAPEATAVQSAPAVASTLTSEGAGETENGSFNVKSNTVDNPVQETAHETTSVNASEPEPENAPETKDENKKSGQTESATSQTVIKPSADAIETLQEEAKLRKEEEQEDLDAEPASGENGSSKPAVNERVVREVEEDENYDE